MERGRRKGCAQRLRRESTEGTEVVLRTLEAGLMNIAGLYHDLVGIDYMQRREKP
jgi:hypothetical protein